MVECMIHRRYGFAPNEVRQAMIEYLRTRDIPAPPAADFTLNIVAGPGVVIEWTEEIEE